MAQVERPYIVLCALDFDETGDHALEEAARIASYLASSELHVIHVAPDLGEVRSDTPTSIRAEVDRAPAIMEERVRRACADTQHQVRCHLRRGSPVDAILETAAQIDADLLILGSHRRRGVEKLVLGSVAERILHEARCAVLTALPKGWHHRETIEIDATCPDCLRARHETPPAQWCTRHSRPHPHPHVYAPSDRPAPFIVWT